VIGVDRVSVFTAAAEAVGGYPDEDPQGPLAAAVGTPGDHDEPGESYSSQRGEGYP